MPAVEPLVWFKSLFKGNEQFFTIHQPPFSLNEDGKHKAAWCGFAEYGTRSFPKVPEGREKGDFVPVTEESYQQHLNGIRGLALAPVFDDGEKNYVCFYGALDIDVRGVDYVWLVKKLYGLGFKFAAFRSKSGGLHVYFFFRQPEPAAKVIETLKRIVEVLALDKLYPRSVEVFPKQASAVPGEKNANGLLLPFFGIGDPATCPNRMYSPDGRLLGIRNAISVVDTLITTLEDVRKTLADLPYGGAPYCIQALLLTGALFKEGDHRNDFLFTAALYLKLKEKTDFSDSLKAMNDRLEGPLEEKDLEDIYESVTTKDYQISGQCKKEPCASYCRKDLCKKREYGAGKGRRNVVSDIEFGKTVRVLTREPYYLVEIRIAGGDEYTQVRFNDTSELMNQRLLQRACVQYLKYAPANMKQDVWIERLNTEILGKIEDQEVSEETDTTEVSLLYRYFQRFIVQAKTQKNAPYTITVGHVYYQDGVYYFESEGFNMYLGAAGFKYSGLNIRAELESFGCTPGELRYKTQKGDEVVVSCWTKQEDDMIRSLSASYNEVYECDRQTAALVAGRTADGGKENYEEGNYEDEDTRF